jgi:acetylornithine aminotransferase
MLAIEELSNAFGAGSHATTFGGTPLVTAVSKAVVTSLLENGWIDHCRVVGDYFKERLEELAKKYGFIKEVRGQGLILGVEMMRPGPAVVKAMMVKGFLINCTQEKVLRFIPPLIVDKEEIDLLVETLENVLDQLKENIK